MTQASVYAPGEKTHRDENFPVASRLITKRHRAAILAFYRFARAADDVADHPDLTEQQKIAQLDQFEETLLGKNDSVADAIALRDIIAERNLSPRHACDLLIAFRQDASKPRYRNWDELMHYCAYSASPVGRFVLDVHGESPDLWKASDALCSVLQIINHLQDCKADYQRLNRIYIPHDALARHSLPEIALTSTQASPALRRCLVELVEKTQMLMQSARFSGQVRDFRLAVEVATIEQLAVKLLDVLHARDPLSEHVHLGKMQVLSIMSNAFVATISNKLFTPKAKTSLSGQG
jgi:squalene synthase HpnC